MADKIDFQQDPYFQEMDRIFINHRRTEQTFPRWLFDDIPEDKKIIMYRALEELYHVGFRQGEIAKAKHIKYLFDNIKLSLSILE